MLVIESRKRSSRENFLISFRLRAKDTRPTYCAHQAESSRELEARGEVRWLRWGCKLLRVSAEVVVSGAISEGNGAKVVVMAELRRSRYSKKPFVALAVVIRTHANNLGTEKKCAAALRSQGLGSRTTGEGASKTLDQYGIRALARRRLVV